MAYYHDGRMLQTKWPAIVIQSYASNIGLLGLEDGQLDEVGFLLRSNHPNLTSRRLRRRDLSFDSENGHAPHEFEVSVEDIG